MILQKYRSKTAERPQRLEGEFLARYMFASKFTKNKTVLDIGTGVGMGARYIALNGAKKVLGIDYSKSAIECAKDKAIPNNLEFEVMNALSMSLKPHSFDVIIAFEVIEHLLPEYHNKFLNSIHRILKAGGICFISTPNKLITSPGKERPYNPYHYKEFKPDELASVLQEHFSEVSLMGVRCINKNYLRQQKEIENSFRHRLTSYLGRYRPVRELLAFIPEGFKRRVTSENRLPSLRASDFEISTNNIQNSEGLLALCTKKE